MGADGFCSYFEALNRGKRSMTLDLRAEGAIEVVHKLIEDADVLTRTSALAISIPSASVMTTSSR